MIQDGGAREKAMKEAKNTLRLSLESWDQIAHVAEEADLKAELKAEKAAALKVRRGPGKTGKGLESGTGPLECSCRVLGMAGTLWRSRAGGQWQSGQGST